MARTTLAGREFEWGAFSETGGMPRNEDSVAGPIFSADGRLLLWAVADGLGGQDAGDQASRAAVKACEMALRSDTRGTLSEVCSRVIETAKQALIALRASSVDTAGAASTLTFLVTDGTSIVHGHVGDSRAYRFHRGDWTQLSEDQSVASAMKKAGTVHGDLRSSPDRSQLFSVLGGDRLMPEVGDVDQLHHGDTFLLCSDGVWEPVTEDRMLSFLHGSGIDEFLSRLRNEAGASTGAHRDNFSAVAIKVANGPPAVKRVPVSPTRRPERIPGSTRTWNGATAASMAVAAVFVFAAGYITGRVTVNQSAAGSLPSTEPAASIAGAGSLPKGNMKGETNPEVPATPPRAASADQATPALTPASAPAPSAAAVTPASVPPSASNPPARVQEETKQVPEPGAQSASAATQLPPAAAKGTTITTSKDKTKSLNQQPRPRTGGRAQPASAAAPGNARAATEASPAQAVEPGNRSP